MSQYKAKSGYRVYEGEWSYSCQCCNQGYFIEYSLGNYEKDAGHSLNNLGVHNYERCGYCGSELAWDGYGGGSPVTDSLISLLKDKHFMASTVILSAVIENSIRDLLWAALVDNGVSQERANKIADGRINRIDSINMISELTDRKIKDISFPYRNLVAHGKGFEIKEETYRKELKMQIHAIRKWVENIKNDQIVSNYCPNQVDRWILFMTYWSKWLESYSIPNYIESVRPQQRPE